MSNVQKRFVLMSRDGITPARLEALEDEADAVWLAGETGWTVQDLRDMRSALGIQPWAARDERGQFKAKEAGNA